MSIKRAVDWQLYTYIYKIWACRVGLLLFDVRGCGDFIDLVDIAPSFFVCVCALSLVCHFIDVA